jgi:hypothetical protein
MMVIFGLFSVNVWVTKEVHKSSETIKNDRMNASNKLARINKLAQEKRHEYRLLRREQQKPTEAEIRHQEITAGMVDARSLEKQKIIYEIPLDEDVLLH